MTLEDILDKIRQEHGLAALRDGNRLMGMFADYSKSQLRPQANALRNFLDCRGNERILNLKDTLGLTQQTEYYRLVQEMVRDCNMQEAIARDVCDAFWRVAAGTEPPVIQSKQTIQLQEPQPIQRPQQVQQTQHTSPMFFTYEQNDRGLTITHCKDKSMESCVIPPTIDGIPVTGIGNWAFAACTRLSSVIIADTVTSIGNWVFCACSNLNKITIPDSVTNIGGGAFNGCTSLTSITIPDSVTGIKPSAFSGCTNLSSISIPKSVTHIGGWVFYGCTSLTSITIPDSVTIIGDWTFYGCTNLSSITIPDSVTSIEGLAFMGCTSLRSVTISRNCTVGSDAFPNTCQVHYY